jgi:hypothetical protein
MSPGPTSQSSPSKKLPSQCWSGIQYLQYPVHARLTPSQAAMSAGSERSNATAPPPKTAAMDGLSTSIHCLLVESVYLSTPQSPLSLADYCKALCIAEMRLHD